MKFPHNGSNKTLTACQPQARALVSLAILLIFFLVSLPVPSSLEIIMDKNQSKMEAVLQEAHAEITQDNPDPAKLR